MQQGDLRMLYRKKELHDGWIFRRGDIYLANLNPFRGSEQGGTRPVLVLQNDIGNYYAPTLIVAPITSRLQKLNQSTHFLLKREGGLYRDSMVELEQIRTIDKSRVEYYIGKISRETMMRIDEVVTISLGIDINEDTGRQKYDVVSG
jgi:mRNA interferase MazF